MKRQPEPNEGGLAPCFRNGLTAQHMWRAGAILAIFIVMIPASVRAYTIEECNLVSSDSMTIMRNFHNTVLDRLPGPTNIQLRDSLHSPLLREDDGLFWRIVELATGDYVEEFRRMSERDREQNRAFIAVQLRSYCLSGRLSAYAINR